MKDQNDSYIGEVKKFRYQGPPKKETLPKQWSNDNFQQGDYSFGKPSATTLNLDSVWSIKRNVAVGQSLARSSKTYGDLYRDTKDNSNFGNTIYSRHKTHSVNPAYDSKSKVCATKGSLQPKKWPPTSANSVSDACSSAQSVKDNLFDEFDIDIPQTATNNWKSQTQTMSGNVRESKGLEFGDSAHMLKKSSGRSNNFNTGGTGYGSKYNSANYFNF